MDADKVETMLGALGEVLDQEQDEHLDIIVCGGMALVMQGILGRRTRDVDGLGEVVEEEGSLGLRRPVNPPWFRSAVERVGVVFGEGKFWFNFSAILLHDETELPAGIVERAEVRQYGERLTIRLCSREDMVCLKMWAAIQRSGPDVGDLQAMEVTEDEAVEGFRWCLDQGGEREGLIAILGEIGHAELAERIS